MALDEQRSEIVGRLVTKSMSTVAKIVEKAEFAVIGQAFRKIAEFKAERVSIEYTKTLATTLFFTKLQTLLARSQHSALTALSKI